MKSAVVGLTPGSQQARGFKAGLRQQGKVGVAGSSVLRTAQYRLKARPRRDELSRERALNVSILCVLRAQPQREFIVCAPFSRTGLGSV